MVRHDAIIIGLGAMGSAAAFQLARRGARVLAFDRFAPPHDKGSSHGETRITRLAIGEGEHLTPLALRSHEIWHELEAETGRSLMTNCGGLVISSTAQTSVTHVQGFFDNTVAAAVKHGIVHERLDPRQIRARFPAFRVRDDEVGYFERDAGFVRPERCIAAQLELAEKLGAELRLNETVLGWHEDSHGVRVRTASGEHEADRAIVTAGAWLPQLAAGDLAKLFCIYRQVLYWFEVDEPRRFQPGAFPVFIWELQGARQGIYGFPVVDGAGGLKIATENYDVPVAPDDVVRAVDENEIARTYSDYVAPQLAGVGPRCLMSKVCLYTVTPDFSFVIDWLAGSRRVLVASACSGHGFKHSAAIGELLAETVLGARSTFDLAPCALKRFLA
ncbi:MAG: N-methyl-L-tryptophan oxidase [Alphaproteobacteria bacterium]|nr:N-methyl-L-tryptophan oxidase [Alphaproteobacteria bacterium]